LHVFEQQNLGNTQYFFGILLHIQTLLQTYSEYMYRYHGLRTAGLIST